MKKMWTVAALLAVAAIPLIIASNGPKKKTVVPVAPVAGDSNDIFEWELREQ
jgi:hypothetical protein